MIKKIISGGQTGADRAAFDFALKYYIPHGGWIPKGRIAEDGPLPDKYQLQEMTTTSYPEYHLSWVEEVLKNRSNQRDAKWMESIAACPVKPGLFI
jgi:hypothetical protein